MKIYIINYVQSLFHGTLGLQLTSTALVQTDLGVEETDLKGFRPKYKLISTCFMVGCLIRKKRITPNNRPTPSTRPNLT